MTNLIKTIRHEADQTISVYGPKIPSRISKGRMIRYHLGMIFAPVTDRNSFLCSPTLPGPEATFETEAEALAFFQAMI